VKHIFGPGRRAASIRSALVLLIGAVALVAVQPSLSRYGVTVTTTVLLYIVGAVAWNVLGGLAGQFSLASSAFVGAGSYAMVMALRASGGSVLLGFAAAIIVGTAVAVAIGAILFRLRGFYFTVGTLAVAIASLAWMTTWEFTGATTGLSAPLSAIPDRVTLFRLALLLAVVAIGVSIALFAGGSGLRSMAVRDDEEVALSLGVSVFRQKLLAIAVSGALTAAAGGMFALQKASIEPFSAFSLDWSVTFIVMAIVGGLARVWGPVVGAVLIYGGITVQLQSLPAVSALLSGAVLIVVIKVLPDGIVGAVERLGRAAVGRVRRRAES
jgi:branched-chain amino acid transport system permease protein